MINKIFLYFNMMQHTINTYEITFGFTKNIAGHAYLGFLYYDAGFHKVLSSYVANLTHAIILNIVFRIYKFIGFFSRFVA